MGRGGKGEVGAVWGVGGPGLKSGLRARPRSPPPRTGQCYHEAWGSIDPSVQTSARAEIAWVTNSTVPTRAGGFRGRRPFSPGFQPLGSPPRHRHRTFVPPPAPFSIPT